MARIPLLSGSRVPVLVVHDDAVLLAPPPALDPLRDVAAAVGEALRYPLSGPPLADLVTRGGRATIVVEPRSLPFPDAANDPRRAAVAAVLQELERLGMHPERHTILVAGGLERRAGRRELESVLRPTQAREFSGSVVVHDAESPELVPLLVGAGGREVHVNPALVETELVVAVTAAETSERGGACALLGASAAEVIASVGPAPSLLAPSLSPAGALAGAIATALAARTPVVGVSLVLDHPRLVGSYRGYPSAPAAVAALARSPLRRIVNTLPAAARRATIRRIGRTISAAAVLAGPPAVSHAEALLRGISLRGTQVAGPLDTIVVPLPWASAHASRESPNPITAASIGLGHALRLWRDACPLQQGGTVVLLHDLRRSAGHGPQEPYRALFQVLREGPTPTQLAAARAAAAIDARAVAAYRQGHAPHPLLAYVDWESCGPILARAGSVLVGGCRDAGSARALGLVPTHSSGTALEMAREVAGGSHRLGVLLAPPYTPLIVA